MLRCLPLALVLLALFSRTAFALITGGEGNSPIDDPGWPAGAAAVFNHPARVAWWEGPPFGGGQWHGEYRGDAKALSAALADFAKLDAKTKRIIVHDGYGHSFWLNPNRKPAKKEAARIDWMFMVWQPANWERLRKLPADLNPTDADDAEKGPPAEIHVYTGGNIRWSEVKIPDGIELIDNRLEAHGFSAKDGTVLEGKVIDLATKMPIAGRMRLERVEPQPKGGYQYVPVADAVADKDGRWVLKKAPAGRHRIVIESDGFVPRVLGYAQWDDEPRWHSYPGALSSAASISGRVLEDEGKPLADVDVLLMNLAAADGRYELPTDPATKTDADGHFRIDQLPRGTASVTLRKPGYVRPGLGQPITIPMEDIALKMGKSASVRVTVTFTGLDLPNEYIVQLTPEGGEAIGKWSGSGKIDAKNQIRFENVPPGRYILTGKPNPSSANEVSKPQTIDLNGGANLEIDLNAAPK